MGTETPGGSGGNVTHTHPFTSNGHFHTHGLTPPGSFGWTSPFTNIETDPTVLTGTTNSKNALPPYRGVYYIMYKGRW